MTTEATYRSDPSLDLLKAARRGDVPKIKAALAAGANIEARAKVFNLRALDLAVRYGHLNAVKALLAAKAQVGLCPGASLAPIHLAAQGRDPEIARLLMIAGSDAVLSEADKLKYARLNSPVARMISGCVQANTALLNAASSGNLLGVQAALETRRADVNVQRACEEWPGEEKSYNAPLHYAAGKNRLEIVRVLVSAGADPDKRDAGGNTPLHVAALANDTDENKKILEILVSAGADPTAQNKAGRTPADYAKAVRKAEIFTMVCSAVLMQVAGIKAQLKYVQALLAAGADVRASNRHGLTALHLAAAGGCTVVVKALLGAGASVNAQDTQGQTALHLAVLELREMAVQRAIVEALLKAGADPALADEHDMTALALAEARGLPADLIENLKKAAGKIAAGKAAAARCATSVAGPSPRGFFGGSGEEKAEARESRAGVTAVLTGST